MARMPSITPVPKEAKMNREQAAEPKSGHRKPAGKTSGSPVGNSSPEAGAAELRSQHPIAHDNHGPHHGSLRVRK